MREGGKEGRREGGKEGRREGGLHSEKNEIESRQTFSTAFFRAPPEGRRERMGRHTKAGLPHCIRARRSPVPVACVCKHRGKTVVLRR